MKTYPDAKGHFGEFGGRYVPETLMQAILDLEKAYLEIKDDPEFQEELNYLLKEYRIGMRSVRINEEKTLYRLRRISPRFNRSPGQAYQGNLKTAEMQNVKFQSKNTSLFDIPCSILEIHIIRHQSAIQCTLREVVHSQREEQYSRCEIVHS